MECRLGLRHGVPTLTKKLSSILFLSTRMYEWVPTYRLGSLPNGWERSCGGLVSHPLLLATETGLPSGHMGQLCDYIFTIYTFLVTRLRPVTCLSFVVVLFFSIISILVGRVRCSRLQEELVKKRRQFPYWKNKANLLELLRQHPGAKGNKKMHKSVYINYCKPQKSFTYDMQLTFHHKACS